jgi:hypothetical protein
MSDISSLLNSLYANDQTVSLEKTAEDSLIAALRDEGQVEENPYASLSDDDLIAILQNDGVEKVASAAAEEEDTDLLEKTAAEMLGGQVMAHAMVHEMSLIKEAMAHGLCRVCKESPMDTEGSSICSGCAAEVA